MRIALVHDYLKEFGGAERVLEAFHEIWPEAPVYTLVSLPKFLGPHQERLKDWRVKPFFPSWLPLIDKLISPLRLLAPILFSRLDLSNYDLVIVSATGAYNPNLIKTKPGVHLCYCHTPPRYLYGLPTAREWKKYWWFRIPAEIANHFLRLVDFRSAQKVDYFIANSKNTAQRIEKFYRKETSVIYPPVDLPERKARRYSLDAKPYYLAGGRITRAKRIDLAIEACNQLQLPLKVFGRAFAGYGEELKRMAGPTIEFLGEITDEEKVELMAGCQAFIFCNLEEDFGIMPVEVQACGRPVICLRQGGFKESVVDPTKARHLDGQGPTGEFFSEPTAESLVEVLKNFDPKKYQREDCLAQAKKFSKERFKREIKEFVKNKL